MAAYSAALLRLQSEGGAPSTSSPEAPLPEDAFQAEMKQLKDEEQRER